jgi:hypothetical protein
VARGWARSQVVVIDDDLGVSAATADVSADIIPDTVTVPGGGAPIDLGVPGLSTRISAAASTPTHAEVLSAQRTRSGMTVRPASSDRLCSRTFRVYHRTDARSRPAGNPGPIVLLWDPTRFIGRQNASSRGRSVGQPRHASRILGFGNQLVAFELPLNFCTILRP